MPTTLTQGTLELPSLKVALTTLSQDHTFQSSLEERLQESKKIKRESLVVYQINRNVSLTYTSISLFRIFKQPWNIPLDHSMRSLSTAERTVVTSSEWTNS